LVVITEVVWTRKFERELRKLRDKTLKNRVKDQIEKILDNPETGKPLRFALKGERSVYVLPYRLIYAMQGETLYLLRFEHRKVVYRA
jgi:mRNA-degrading endonuclease RelE of RelBE toxin-antitoxin system